VSRSRSPNNLLAYLLVFTGVWVAQMHLVAAPRHPPVPPTSPRAAAPVAPPRPAVPAKAAPEKEFVKSWDVQGFGSTHEDAWQDALEKAQTQVINYLHERQPALGWVPPVEYVQRHLLKGDVKDEPKDLGPPVGLVRCVQMRIEVTSDDRADMLQLARHALSQRRMHLAAEILAGLVALLMSVACYVRLDEWTKGYYTFRLRLATAGFLAAVGLAFWLLA
jgi:hypothetical protein